MLNKVVAADVALVRLVEASRVGTVVGRLNSSAQCYAAELSVLQLDRATGTTGQSVLINHWN
jgi:hypothetical protein